MTGPLALTSPPADTSLPSSNEWIRFNITSSLCTSPVPPTQTQIKNSTGSSGGGLFLSPMCNKSWLGLKQLAGPTRLHSCWIRSWSPSSVKWNFRWPNRDSLSWRLYTCVSVRGQKVKGQTICNITHHRLKGRIRYKINIWQSSDGRYEAHSWVSRTQSRILILFWGPRP